MNRKGFTLIELLGVIVIIGLVVGLSSFGIIKVYNNSKDKSLALTNESIKKAAITYSEEKANDVNYWKKSNNNSYFCVTVIELINKGYLKKDKIKENRYNDYVSVIKNDITRVTEDTVIFSDSEPTENVCNENVINERVTNPEIKNIGSYTDEIDFDFVDPDVESEIIGRKCRYKDLNGITNEFLPSEDNKCQISGLEDSTDYFELGVCAITSKGSKVCSYPNNIKTKDLKIPTITVNNTVEISFDDTNIKNKEEAGHYFKSTLNGNTTDDVLKCTLNNNIFTCEENSTNVVEKNVWYMTYEDKVNITYNESGEGVVTAGITDKSNNYKENTKEISVYNIKFMKGDADTVGDSTSDIDNYCVAEKNASCSITSPEAIKEGSIFIGWNTNSNATTSIWDANIAKQVNKNDTYYPIWNEIEISNKPVITSITNSSGGNWTTDNVIIRINVTSKDKIESIQYSYDQKNWGTTYNLSTPISVNGSNYVFEATWMIETNENLYLKAVDINGNESDVKTTPVRIDRTPPIFNVTLIKNGTGLASFTTNSYEYPDDVVDGVTIKISDVRDTMSGINRDYYFAWNAPYLEEYSETPADAEERTLTKSFRRLTDSRDIELYGKRVIWITLSDKVGNESVITIKINIKNSKVSGNRFICDSSNLLSVYYITGCPDTNPGYCNHNSLNGLENLNSVVRNDLMTTIAAQCIVNKVIHTSSAANCRMGASTTSTKHTILYNCTPVNVAYTTTSGWALVTDYGCYVNTSLIGDSCYVAPSSGSSGGHSGGSSGGSSGGHSGGSSGGSSGGHSGGSSGGASTSSCRCYKKNGSVAGKGLYCYNGYKCKKTSSGRYVCCQ